MSQTLRRAPILALASLSLLAAPLAADRADAAAPGGLDIPGTILRSGDYNTGNLSQWSGYQASQSYSIGIQSSLVREGSHAARFEVRNGDNPIGYGDRAEVQASTGESEGKERWYSWSTRFDPAFPSYSTWQVISQWHANANGSPPIGFYAEGDTWVLKLHRHSAPGQLIDIKNIWRGSLRRGEWQDVRLHIKWSGSDTVGFVELWIDGVRQTFDDGSQRRYIRTLYPGVGAYFKQGLYRQSGLSQTGIVYHDGFRMSDGQGGTTPVPEPTPPPPEPEPEPEPEPAPPPAPAPDPEPAPPPSSGAVPALAQPVPAGNLTPNPAFAGALSNWVTWQGAASAQTASDGSTVALVSRTTGGVFTLDDDSPSVAAPVGGAQYRVIAWVRAANAQSVGKRARVYARQPGQQDVAGSAVTLSSSWQQSAVTVTARGTTPLDARVGFEGAVAGDAMHVGMVSAAPAAAAPAPAPAPDPEPAPAPPPSPGALLDEGFEGVLPGQSGSPLRLLVGTGNRFSIVTAPVRSGSKAAAFEQAGSGNQVTVGRTFARQSDVTASVSVYVARNVLGTNRSRSVLRVLAGSGWSNGPRHEVGIFRDGSGAMHWAVWSVGRNGRYTPAVLGAAPKVGAWQTLRLQTQWNRSVARARLTIDGAQALSPAAVDLAGVSADGVEAGLNYSNSADKALIVLDDLRATTEPLASAAALGAGRARTALAGPFSPANLALRAPRRLAPRARARMTFSAPSRARYTVSVLRGRRVVSRASRTSRPGLNRVTFRAPAASGAYTVRLAFRAGAASTGIRVGGRR